MKNKFVMLLVALVMVLSFSSCAFAADFTDTEHWAKNHIEYSIEQGYFKGTSDTTFEPTAPMTRGMFVTVLGRYEQSKGNINLNDYKLSPFVDIAAEQYYTKPVLWAYENDIVEGMSSNAFAPNDFITREQAAVILNRYLKLDEKLSIDITTVYKDWKDVSDWARDSVAVTTQYGLFVGYNDCFSPKANITRAEMAVLMARLDGKSFDLYEPPKEKLTYIGTFSNTFYCPCYRCNGNTHGITASGAPLTPYLSVAVDRRLIPLGTELYIEFENENAKAISGYYVAHDTGGAIKGNKIDVCVSSHSEAYYYGVGKCKVYIVERN